MMKWVYPMMWGFYDLLADTMTTVGFLGLLYFVGRGLMWVTDKILEEDAQ